MKPHISPIARAVLDSDFANVRAITDDMPKDSPSAPAYQALRKAADAIENIIPADHALPAIRNALHRPPDDTELFFLLLHMGIALSHHRLEFAGDKERFSLLMKELLNNLRHPEFKACWLDERFGIQHSLHPGDHASRDIMNEALSLDISRDTGLWIRLKLNHAVASLHEMDLAAAENDLAEVESLIPRHPQFMNEFRRVRASWYQRTGNNDQALQILQDVPRNAPSAANMLHLRLGILCEAERWEEFDRELAVLQKSPVPFFKPAIDFYFRARKEYKQGHPEKARELAREAISLIKGQEIWNPNLLLVGCIELLAMAELSLRNSKTARLLLDMIDPNTSKIGYASLRMRLFLLEGNEPQAAVFLKRILAIGEHGPKFLARGLRNAPEVTAYQMENLRILASQMPSPSPAPADSASPPESAPFPTLLGENAAIRKAKTLIRKYAPLDTTVLITGETGTGKDVVARLIHESSPRARHPFIAVNCASISDSLMEAELFGYVKGAFTGATSNHDGLFTTAGQGTLFLDDVESMPARLQAGLLRVLESGEIRPVGGTRIRKTTARIVAATNVPLDELVKKGTFREDLFYRLARFEITLPPLRERKDDIPILAKHFLKKIYASHPEGPPELGESLLHALEHHDWRGNVRELENEIQRIAILAGDRRVLESDLFRAGPSPAETPSDPGKPQIRASTRERRERLRVLFHEQPHLAFMEVVNTLHCSRDAALSDLKNLECEKFIHRVQRIGGTRTLYYTRTK